VKVQPRSMTLSPDLDGLLSAAREARERAYAPYSNFRVGAALDTGDGNVIVGSNVENASYGLSMCAERAAIFAAVSAGFRDFTAIAIAGPEGALTSPCGACRQVLAEFNPTMTVVFTAPSGEVETTVAELLPYSFGPFV
jgi:cytidine deaminase